MSVVATITRLREVLTSDLVGIERVYGADSEDENLGLPGGLTEFPAALIWLGQTTDYRQHPGGSDTHEYEISLFLVGGTLTHAAASAARALPFVDRLISLGQQHLNIASVTYFRFQRQGGLEVLNHSGGQYLGFEITFAVTETNTGVDFERGE
jgi:hypothetical protein